MDWPQTSDQLRSISELLKFAANPMWVTPCRCAKNVCQSPQLPPTTGAERRPPKLRFIWTLRFQFGCSAPFFIGSWMWVVQWKAACKGRRQSAKVSRWLGPQWHIVWIWINDDYILSFRLIEGVLPSRILRSWGLFALGCSDCRLGSIGPVNPKISLTMTNFSWMQSWKPQAVVVHIY